MSLWPYVWIHTVYAQTAFICIHTCAGQVLLKQTSALPNKGSHVFSDEQRSQMIRLCFRNMVAFCLQSVCWGWTQRHLYPRPLSNLNVYLVFLIGQSRLTELSEQFGRSVECSGVVAHLNSSTKNTPHPKKPQQQLCTGSESTESSVCLWQEETKRSNLCCVDLWQAVAHLVQGVMCFFPFSDVSLMCQGWNKRESMNTWCFECCSVPEREIENLCLCVNRHIEIITIFCFRH